MSRRQKGCACTALALATHAGPRRADARGIPWPTHTADAHGRRPTLDGFTARVPQKLCFKFGNGICWHEVFSTSPSPAAALSVSRTHKRCPECGARLHGLHPTWVRPLSLRASPHLSLALSSLCVLAHSHSRSRSHLLALHAVVSVANLPLELSRRVAPQPSIWSSRYSSSSGTLMRRCSVESRSRSVTVSSSRVSKSTVMQKGVPTSSMRR